MSASVARLWHYPVKSMRGAEVDEIVLSAGGVVDDRAYGFLDVETGKLVSAKRPKWFGALLECQARFLSPPSADAPSPPIEVTFPDGTVVTDDDHELTRRTSQLLGREVRLITTADALVEAMQAESPDSDGDRIVDVPVAMAAPGTLLDLAALHVMATSTLRTLAAEHPDGDWDPRRMRPNMLIDADDDEDRWLGCDLQIGTRVVIHVVQPVPRCVMTTLAQGELPKDAAVLRMIAAVGLKQVGPLGQFACAGSYAEVVEPGVVRTGDPVRVERVQPRQGALAATMDMLAAGLRK